METSIIEKIRRRKNASENRLRAHDPTSDQYSLAKGQVDAYEYVLNLMTQEDEPDWQRELVQTLSEKGLSHEEAMDVVGDVCEITQSVHIRATNRMINAKD